jgi:pimeloyl-ACP methyl ester carboxylesterase
MAQMRRVPLATVLDAMRAACSFSSHRWIGGVDVPTAVVVTRHDRIVPPQRQRKLAAAVPGAVVVEIDGDHGVFLADPDGFADGLLQACAAVTLPVAPSSSTAA